MPEPSSALPSVREKEVVVVPNQGLASGSEQCPLAKIVRENRFVFGVFSIHDACDPMLLGPKARYVQSCDVLVQS